jgi:hypothetical protein
MIGLKAFTTAQTTAKAVELCSNIVKGTRRNGIICICGDDRRPGGRLQILHPAKSRLCLTAPEPLHHRRHASTNCAPTVASMLLAWARLSERCDRESNSPSTTISAISPPPPPPPPRQSRRRPARSRTCRSDLSRRRPAAASTIHPATMRRISRVTPVHRSRFMSPLPLVGSPLAPLATAVVRAPPPRLELLALRRKVWQIERCGGPTIVTRHGNERTLRHTKRRRLLLASADIPRTDPRPMSSAHVHHRHAGPLPVCERARLRVLPALLQQVSEEAQAYPRASRSEATMRRRSAEDPR